MKLINDDFNDLFERRHSEKRSGEDPAEVVYGETKEEREERELRESTIERRHNKKRIALAVLSAFLAVFVLWWVWNHFFNVYRSSSEKGVIMECGIQGTIFKTIEGKMMSMRVTTAQHIYETDFLFTVANDSLGTLLGRLAGTGKPVQLTYDEYNGTLPWRGESKIVVTAVDTAGIDFNVPASDLPKQKPAPGTIEEAIQKTNE